MHRYQNYQPIDKESFSKDMQVIGKPVSFRVGLVDENGSTHDAHVLLPNRQSNQYGISKSRLFFIFGLISICFIGLTFMVSSSMNGSSTVGKNPLMADSNPEGDMFDNLGRYIMRDYDLKKPMSNFLSGISGFWGVPMWTFYVNRGQGITSFGVQNKDGMIEKFQSAEKAYQLTPFTGFRTFVEGQRGDSSFIHMPFFPKSIHESYEDSKISRNMMVGGNEMEIEEIAPAIGLQTNVLYFNLPSEDFPSLVRRTTFTNLGSDSLTLDVLDGLDKLVPSGLSNTYVDSMGRLAEAYMNVYNVGDRRYITEPFFHISQGTVILPIKYKIR